VISHAYFSIFYSAKAYLISKGIKTSAPEEHKKTYEEFKRLVDEKIVDRELLELYDDAIMKAESLLEIFHSEKKKRGHFTYNVQSEANKPYAEKSVANAKKIHNNYQKDDTMKKPISCNIFHKVHFVEKWGTGIGKIKGLEPKAIFEEVADFFLVTFQRRNVPETTQKIIELIKEKSSITREELALAIGITPDGVKYNLQKLIKEGKIKRIGPDKGGHWEIS
jgi:uncharacterized protein (UPF0332 family)